MGEILQSMPCLLGVGLSGALTTQPPRGTPRPPEVNLSSPQEGFLRRAVRSSQRGAVLSSGAEEWTWVAQAWGRSPLALGESGLAGGEGGGRHQSQSSTSGAFPVVTIGRTSLWYLDKALQLLLDFILRLFLCYKQPPTFYHLMLPKLFRLLWFHSLWDAFFTRVQMGWSIYL